MTDEQFISDLKGELADQFEFTEMPSGMLRIRTPIRFSDGTLVDVFLADRGDSQFELTDLGETYGLVRTTICSIPEPLGAVVRLESSGRYPIDMVGNQILMRIPREKLAPAIFFFAHTLSTIYIMVRAAAEAACQAAYRESDMSGGYTLN